MAYKTKTLTDMRRSRINHEEKHNKPWGGTQQTMERSTINHGEKHNKPWGRSTINHGGNIP